MLRIRNESSREFYDERPAKKRKTEFEYSLPLLNELWVRIAKFYDWEAVWEIATTCKGLLRCFTSAETLREIFDWFFNRNFLDGRVTITYLPSWLFTPLPFKLTGCYDKTFSSLFRGSLAVTPDDVESRLSSLVKSIGRELNELSNSECEEFMVSGGSVSQIIFGKEWQCDKDVWVHRKNYEAIQLATGPKVHKEEKFGLDLVCCDGTGCLRDLYKALYNFDLSIVQHGAVAVRDPATLDWGYEEYTTPANIYTRHTGIIICNTRGAVTDYHMKEAGAENNEIAKYMLLGHIRLHCDMICGILS
jgi:hypothetical protein